MFATVFAKLGSSLSSLSSPRGWGEVSAFEVAWMEWFQHLKDPACFFLLAGRRTVVCRDIQCLGVLVLFLKHPHRASRSPAGGTVSPEWSLVCQSTSVQWCAQLQNKVDGNKFSTLCLLVILANAAQLHLSLACGHLKPTSISNVSDALRSSYCLPVRSPRTSGILDHHRLGLRAGTLGRSDS